jgi:hypothetical protein
MLPLDRGLVRPSTTTSLCDRDSVCLKITQMNVTVSDSKDEGISKSLTKCFSRMVDARQVQDEVLRIQSIMGEQKRAPRSALVNLRV